jgi:DNA-binding transcriptional regulator YiaG
MVEEWKYIDDLQFYQISNLGNVRSVDRVVETRKGPQKYKGKILKERITIWGYSQIAFRFSGKRNQFYVHRLVAYAFLGHEKGKEINHKNGIKTDNRLENLEWVTRSENVLHSIKIGLRNYKYLENMQPSRQHKLTIENILEIKKLKYKISQPKLAKKFNVSKSLITKIHRGVIWGHIQ